MQYNVNKNRSILPITISRLHCVTEVYREWMPDVIVRDFMDLDKRLSQFGLKFMSPMKRA